MRRLIGLALGTTLALALASPANALDITRREGNSHLQYAYPGGTGLIFCGLSSNNTPKIWVQFADKMSLRTDVYGGLWVYPVVRFYHWEYDQSTGTRRWVKRIQTGRYLADQSLEQTATDVYEKFWYNVSQDLGDWRGRWAVTISIESSVQWSDPAIGRDWFTTNAGDYVGRYEGAGAYCYYG